MQGKCFTLVPKIAVTKTGPETGWSLMLAHDTPKMKRNPNYPSLRSAIDSISGFHVFLHQTREPYFGTYYLNVESLLILAGLIFVVVVENKLQVQSIMEYMYLEVGEELEIKISAEHFNQIPSSGRPCVTDINYSASQVNSSDD